MDDLLARALALPLLAEAARRPGAWLVGGAVRDLLRGEAAAPRDLDVVLEDGDPGAFAAALAGPRAEVEGHERFGTARVSSGETRLDFTRARAESYPRPGALPVVRPAGLTEDLRRRDFTVNTFALALGPPEPGRLLSVPPAREDLAAGLLRILHPASFSDDPTRLLRLARYAGRLGYAVEDGTRRAAREALAARALRTVSGPRLGAELRLLAADHAALAGFAALAELGVAEALAPGFGLDGAAAGRALELLPGDGRADLLLLALAVRRVGDPAGLLDSLGFPREDVRRVEAALRAPADLAGAPPSVVAARLQTPEQAALAGTAGAAREARRWAEELRHVRLALGGEDVLAAGAVPGPEVGRVLRELLELRLDGALPDDRDAQLAAARRLAAT